MPEGPRIVAHIIQFQYMSTSILLRVGLFGDLMPCFVAEVVGISQEDVPDDLLR